MKSYIQTAKGCKEIEIYDSLKTDKRFVDSIKTKAQTIEVGFVCLDVSSGEIKAMVGGRDQEFNFGLKSCYSS